MSLMSLPVPDGLAPRTARNDALPYRTLPPGGLLQATALTCRGALQAVIKWDMIPSTLAKSLAADKATAGGPAH